MDAPQLESMYRRWLSEVWDQGRTDVARELLAEDVVDHNPYPGQPPGSRGTTGRLPWSAGHFPTCASPTTS
jgi:hypothetical protein